MNITLRKANAIQTSINDVLKNISFNTDVTLNEFVDPTVVIARAQHELGENLRRREKLLNALYEIRKSVGAANAQVGIDSRLADVAHLEKQYQFVHELANRSLALEHQVVTGKLDKIRNRKEDNARSIYGRDDEVSTSILQQLDLDTFRSQASAYRKEKQKLQDEILELNVQTQIQLSNSTVEILMSVGLI